MKAGIKSVFALLSLGIMAQMGVLFMAPAPDAGSTELPGALTLEATPTPSNGDCQGTLCG